VANGRVVYSVSAEGGVIRLYEMDSDQEVVFRDAGGLTAWLQEHRPEAMQDAPVRPDGKKRVKKKLFEW
jgi:hypothetical protein